MARANPLVPKAPHFRPRAKRIIHLFMNGGPSHVDTFDPKPALQRFAGKMLPVPNLATERKTGAAFPSPYKFRQYGQSGLPVSEIFPHTARHMDDICVLRSMRADVPNHEPSLMLMNCGESILTRPSMGSWMTYGLGTENQNLPGFIAMCPGYPIQESQNWQCSFLPGAYQGTYVDTRKRKVDELIEHIRNPRMNLAQQRRQRRDAPFYAAASCGGGAVRLRRHVSGDGAFDCFDPDCAGAADCMDDGGDEGGDDGGADSGDTADPEEELRAEFGGRRGAGQGWPRILRVERNAGRVAIAVIGRVQPRKRRECCPEAAV